MDLIFCKIKKAKKTWIQFFASLQKLKKHGFNFLKAQKHSKNMNLIFYKLKEAQKRCI